jgi:PAS domain S-box-containing protein
MEVRGHAEADAAGQPVRSYGVMIDITERKQAEKAMEKAHADAVTEKNRLEAVMQALPVAVAITDAHGGNTHSNSLYEEIWGSPRPATGSIDDYAAYRAWWPDTGEPVLPEQWASAQAVQEGRTVVGQVMEIERFDGRRAFILNSGAPIRDADGAIIGSAVAIQDITAIKRAEEALRLSESRYRTLHESLRDPFVQVSMEGRTIECNELYCKLLGYSPEEVSALTYQDVTPERWRDYEEAIVRDQIIARGYSDVYEKEYRRKDGTIVPVELRTVLSRNAAGEPTAMWGIVRDITERKRAEKQLFETNQRLQALMEAVPVGVSFSDDPSCQHITGNPAVLTQFEITPQDNLSASAPDAAAPGRQVRFFRDGRQINDAELPLQRAVAENRVIPPMELEVQLPSGQRWFADASGAPVRDAQGRVIGGIAVTVDVTDRKRAEEALVQAKAAAEAAAVAKGQFLANMSHELRTPMNAILGMIDVALPKATDPTVQDCLQTAKGSADLLLTLLNDLLDSAKIESGKLELESAPFSLRRMLDQITRVLAVRASEKGLVFYCRLSEETPDVVMGDRTRLQQILLNLAGNAIKFTERGEVEIGLHALSHDGDVCLEFAVRDTGIGIPPSSIEHLFQPFGQADASMSRRFGGTGLGLSISRSLVEMMGGRIRAESEVGKGSTFYFTVRLPLAKECPPDSPSAPAIPVLRAATLRILLVEDNPANQKLAAYILQDRGHTVEIAADGQEALRSTEQDRYDVILMDVQMPGMDGLEATAAIRKREEGGGRRTPIIAMTAHAMKSDRERCLAAGMDGYLSKPIDPREMVALVERLASISLSEKPTVAPSVSVFDPASALKQCLGKPDLLAQMIHFFFDDADRLLPQIRETLERGDLTKVGELGHKLKGTITHLAAQRARESAFRVEHVGQSGGNQAAAQEAVAMLEQECLTLKAALAEYQAAAVPAPHGSSARPANATLFQQ